MQTPLAKELAEYWLLENDLFSAHDTLAIWFDKYSIREVSELTKEEKLISQSLFRDAIIMFVGCFDNSAPLKLSPEDIYGSIENGVAFFEYLKDIRNSYAAHKFGPYRQCVVGVTIDETTGLAGEVGKSSRIYRGFKIEAKEQTLNFIRIAGHYVSKKMDDLRDGLMESAKAMTPAELAALKTAQTYDVQPNQIRISRKAFRNLTGTGNDN